jgi:hypothetical protein
MPLHLHLPTDSQYRYWLSIVDAIAADVKSDANSETQSATLQPMICEDSLVSALELLGVHQLIVGMDEPDLLSASLIDAMLHPVDFAFLKVLRELMTGAVSLDTHEMLCWCSEYSGDCAFVLSSLLTVGDARMGLERDVIRASILLQQCSSKSDHVLCRLAWSSRPRVNREVDERAVNEQNMDDLDSLLQVPQIRECLLRM